MRKKPICLVIVAWMVGLLCANSAVRAEGEEAEVADPVVAVFSLHGPITEKPTTGGLSFSSLQAKSLKDLLVRMRKAREDESVPAVVLLMGQTSLGNAQIEEIRQVLDELESSGKKVFVHADSMTMRDYVLLSGASKLSMVPTGHLFILGVRSEQPYLRGLLEMIGVTPDFLTCGDFKSAGEMFMRKEPSPEADRMMNWLFDGLYENDVNHIAKGRNVEPEKVREWIDEGLYTAEKAQQAGLIDEVQYRQDFEAELKQAYGEKVRFDRQYGKEKAKKIDLSSPFGVSKLYSDLLQGPQTQRKPKRDAVALVYVEGMIVAGEDSGSLFGDSGIAYSTPIRKALDRAAEEDSVKAVVLRIDSGGGSAVASEIILNAARRIKSRKPIIVSMGNVAGSGGYYVACGADTIFADPSTVTGSIGVISGKFATTEMWNKIGIHWKSYQRGANAGLLATDDVFTDQERDKLQSWMNEVYEVFKKHVVSSRGDRLKKDIDEIAGGRIYTGRQALELGLVDQLGGLHDAIGHAAEQAKLTDYEIRVMPKPKNLLEVLLSDLGQSQENEENLTSPNLGLTAGKSISLLELARPYLKGLEPHRLETIRKALHQLTLLQQESVLLAMPVIHLAD